mgnify:CR=1 FL=1
MFDPEDESTWPWTPEQQRRDQILRQARLPIESKLDWLEYAQELATRFGARKREDLGKKPSGGE